MVLDEWSWGANPEEEVHDYHMEVLNHSSVSEFSNILV